jgi:hypothetical protein
MFLGMINPTAAAYWRKKACPGNAQGIEAVSFFAAGKKDTSGKPGPGAKGARMRPKNGITGSYAFIADTAQQFSVSTNASSTAKFVKLSLI